MVTAGTVQQRSTPGRDSLIECLLRFAETDPDRDAVVTPMAKLTNAELAERVLGQAQWLCEAGVSGDCTVGIQCADDTRHLILCLAIMQTGATSFAIPTHETPQFQESIIKHCRATHIVDGDTIDRISRDTGTVAMPAGESRLLFSTSGTTGEPKLVIHHDSDLVAQAHRHIGSQHERFACLASMEHNFVKRHRLYCVAVGATNVFLSAKQESLVSQCQAQKVNVLHVSAFQAQELLAVPDIGSLSELRLKLGGSHVPLKLRQQLRKRITNNLQAGYGTTETGAIAFTDPDDNDSDESVGQALNGIEVRVVDADRVRLDTGDRGELAIRCKGMFRGYLGNPELSKSRLDDGWFYTGDIGYLDREQRIHLCGRSDDMFMFNSMNIYPQDIESRICRFPGVSEALVLPRPSAVHGNIPVAFVVFAEGVQPDMPAVKAYVQEQVGARSPRQFTSVENLPRNASGKISRRDALTLPAKCEQVRSLMLAALSDDAKRRLKPSAIAAFKNGDADIALGGTGLDSFARMEMLVALELEYGVVIAPDVFARFRTFGDISSHVLSAPPQEAPQPITCFLAIDTTLYTSAQVQTLRFFQRVFRYCPTVAQLNKALLTLEHRFTPQEFTLLRDRHLSDQLLPSNISNQFRKAVTTWIQKVDHLMRGSGKQQPEPFTRYRIAPSVLHFAGPGRPRDKKLLVCFAPKAGRQLTVPNSVLMQHTDSAQYDLLVVADSARESYRLGIPLIGRNIDEVIQWIGNLALVGKYSAIRTIGCSAGAYLAVIAGFRLGAELAVSVAGRFYAERYPLRILGRIFSTWRTVRNSNDARVLMSYPADKGKSRDRIYARIIGKLTGGSLLGLEFTDGEAGHHFLQRLAERGELARYLDHTIFAGLDDAVASERVNLVFSLPAGRFRPAD